MKYVVLYSYTIYTDRLVFWMAQMISGLQLQRVVLPLVGYK